MKDPRRSQRLTPLFAVLLGSVFFLCAPAAHASTTITTCAQLQAIGATSTELSSDSYILGTSIDCSATATWNPISGGGYFGFFPLANFTGTFNGNGHTISGLYINSATSTDVGLFSEVSGTGLVENLGLASSTIIGDISVGAFIGNMQGTASLQSASTTASVSSPNGDGGDVGGLVGSGNSGTTITNATSSASIEFAGRGFGIGGIVGYYRGTVQNSDANGTISVSGLSPNAIGGLVGYNEVTAVIASSTSNETISAITNMAQVGGIAGVNYNSITGSYFTGSISAGGDAQDLGGIVGEDNSTFGVQDSYYNIDTVSIMGTNISTPHGIYTTQYNAWVNGGYDPLNFATYFPSTDGSGYYDLANIAALKNLLAFTDTDLSSKKFLITSPIALPAGFLIPTMNALEFNGGNNALSGFSINALAWEQTGFFGTIALGTTVKNIFLPNVNITAQEGGGLAYVNNGAIENSSVTGSITANFSIGGLVADNEGTIATSTASTTITGVVAGTDGFDGDPGTIGGSVGVNNGFIWGSSATGSITANQDTAGYLGGLTGGNDEGSISGSSANVAISATGADSDYIGGLAGYSDDPISNSFAIGAIQTGPGSVAAFIGGLVGYADNDAPITDSYATGAVEGNAQTGGLVGSASAAIHNSYALGNVTGTGHIPNAIGGFVGYNNTTIQNAFSTGSVTIDASDATVPQQIGGFVGYNGYNIRDSYSLGNVISERTADDVGGFVGDNVQNIFNDYSAGSVIDAADNHTAAGFIGINEAGAEVFSSAWYTGANANAIGTDDGFPGYDVRLSDNGHGTDVATSSDFYVTTQPAYTTGGFPWDFMSTWTAHATTYPTLQAFPSYQPVTLAATTPIASPVTGTTATYTFAVSNSVSRPGVFQLNGCGAVAQVSTSTNEVAFSGLTAGPAYSCSLAYHLTDDGTNSNALFIGPFTVAGSQASPPAAQSMQGVSGQKIAIIPVTASSTLGVQWASLMAEYQSLLAQLAALKGGVPAPVTVSSSTVPTADLQLGSKGPEVTVLQDLLIQLEKGTSAAALKAAGTSSYFGPLTKAALIEYQKAVGIEPPSGYFGPFTRAEMKSKG